MADNTTLNSGSGGDVIATDEITDAGVANGAKVQRVKIGVGTDNNYADISDSNPLPIDDAGGTISVDDGGGALTVDGTVTADAGTGPWPVTDNGGSLTVDGSVTLGANSGTDIGDVDVTSVVPGTAATSLGKAVDSVAGGTDTGIAALAVRDDSLTTLTPADGDYAPLRVSSTGALHVTGGGGGTEYNEDAATPATITGTATVMERDDAIGTLTPIEGDWAAMRCSAEGALWTQDFNSDGIAASLSNIEGAVGGTAVDDSAFTVGTDDGVPVFGLADETATDTVDEGDVGALRMTTRRALYTTFETPAGDSPWDDTNDALQVNVVAGATSGTEYTEDAAAAANPVGGALIGVRDDLLDTATVSADGDNIAARFANTGAQYTAPGNFVSTNNSTTATLGISGVYTGTGDDCTGYTAVTIMLDSDQDSATDGMTFQFSTDNTNWDDVYSFTYTAGSCRRFQFPITGRYFRIVYTNGGTGQTHFRAQTIFHANNVLTSIHRLADDMSPDRSAQVVKSVLYAQAAGSGDFTAVDTTAGGNLKISIEEGTQTPADNYANPIDAVNSVALGMAWDGSNWDRVPGNSTDGISVNLGTNNDVTVTGGNAHDGTTLGNPVLGGARATNSVEGLTQVANADLTHIQADLNGVLLSRPHTTLEEIISERVSNTNGTSTAFATFAAGGAGIHNYVTDITVTNTSATDGYLDIRDGTAGSVLWTIPLPANSGATHSFSLPLKGAANTALAYDVSAALTTVYISINGFQAQG